MHQNNRILVRQRIALLIAILVFGSFTASAQTNVFNLADFDPVGDGGSDDGEKKPIRGKRTIGSNLCVSFLPFLRLIQVAHDPNLNPPA